MKIDLNIDIKTVAKVYRKYMRDENLKKYNIFYGGVGSGKSFYISQRLVYKCLKEKRKILILRKVGTSLKDSVIAQILLILEKWQLMSFVKYNKTEREIIFPNGSSILFKGYDNPERVKSIVNITDVWIEEATEFSQDDFEQIKERVRGTSKNNEFYISFNPIDINHWIRSYFFDNKDKVLNPRTTLAVKTIWTDNPWVGENYRELFETMKIKNPKRYAVSALGNWGVLGEIIFEEYDVKDLSKLNDNMFEDISYGLDFGFAHKTGMVKVGIKNGDLYVLEELYFDKLTTGELMKQIKKKWENWEWLDIVADSARPEAIKEMKDAGFNVFGTKKYSGSVIESIEYMNDRRIIIDEKCRGLLAEIRGYQFEKDRNGIIMPRPVKSNDDLIDAFRYSTEKFRNKKQAFDFA